MCNNYHVFRSSNAKRGRGVLTAIFHTYSAEVISTNSPLEQVDLLIVKMHIKNVPVLIINLYIPPSTPIEDYGALLDHLENCCDLSNYCIIAGDFNIPELYACLYDNRSPTNLYNAFVAFLTFNNLIQHNRVLNANGRILDAIVTSDAISSSIEHNIEPQVKEDSHHP
ncbi:hypothetical protein Zmor_001501 [Zophobas morio]|uniref:Endonuclease/exonuclease/phosphatase domain-containing protein n=1 Tax=Zophobas morio TaxID=2755281 RepID=A0AA38IZ68_9CUCU|nr:hypothetical protein Zmor_001501 [Zophobas morio]